MTSRTLPKPDKVAESVNLVQMATFPAVTFGRNVMNAPVVVDRASRGAIGASIETLSIASSALPERTLRPKYVRN